MSLGYPSLKADLLFVFADFIRVPFTQRSYGASRRYKKRTIENSNAVARYRVQASRRHEKRTIENR